MDKRVLKTQQTITEAFVSLLAKTSYEKVSVTDIIEAANIGRSTFYNHYETKDELAREICDSLFLHIFTHDIPPCSTHDFSKLPQNAENRIAHMLYHIRDKREYYKGILEYDDGSLFLQFMRDFMMLNIRVLLSGPSRTRLLEIPEDFIINQVTSSFIA